MKINYVELDDSVKFFDTLRNAYFQVRSIEKIEYVSLYQILKLLQKKYNIDGAIFGKLLSKYFNIWLKDGKKIALEVDATPKTLANIHKMKKENRIYLDNNVLITIIAMK